MAKAKPSNNHKTILVCQGTGCVSGKSLELTKALEKAVAKLKIPGVDIDFTGCHGFCEQGPVAIVEPEGIFYTQVTVDDAEEIIESHIRDGKPVERLFYKDPATGEAVPKYQDITFYSKQHRIILRNCGHVNPEKIDDYINAGGYQALPKAIKEM
ncbi:MAG: NAD(P)H-dependent oxidoreductase subunit E, partial [Dehalococcoidia bacterium]